MANKVRVTALFLVLAILIATFGAVSVVQAKTVGDVEKLEIIEEGQQTDCTLRWHRVKGADGYQIFQSVSDKKDFDKVKTVEGKKNTRVQLTDLRRPLCTATRCGHIRFTETRNIPVISARR